jgi:adenine specific DNA methylase Mod
MGSITAPPACSSVCPYNKDKGENMKGTAHLGHFATKEDFYNIREREPDKAKSVLSEAFADRKIWVTVKTLLPSQAGREDATNRVIETTETGSDEIIWVQQKLRVDANAHIYRLGFTEAEIDAFLSGGYNV